MAVAWLLGTLVFVQAHAVDSLQGVVYERVLQLWPLKGICIKVQCLNLVFPEVVQEENHLGARKVEGPPNALLKWRGTNFISLAA